MKPIVSDQALDTLFRTARSYNRWTAREVNDVAIQAIYDLMRWGPTSTNSNPARFLFVRSDAAKQKLISTLLPANVAKVREAPVTVIIGYDLEFYEKIPQLMPHNPAARGWYAGNDQLIEDTAFRNSSLQGAYLMIAARALGYDCGPLSGFDNAKVDDLFFAGTKVKSNFICSLGEGSEEGVFPRNPRLAFDEACQIL